MPQDPPPEPPGIPEEAEDIFDLVTDETPGVGTFKRIYRLAKRRISKEYIEEINKLRAKLELLDGVLQEQAASSAALRKYIEKLEQEIEELKRSSSNAPAPEEPNGPG